MNEAPPTRTPITARGPLNNETQALVRSMARSGSTAAEIAEAIGRSEKAVSRIIEARKSKAGAGKARPKAPVSGGKSSTPVPTARAAPASKAPTAGESLLKHQFWVRPNMVIEFNLPADFRPHEAKRLADVIHSLPFEPLN